MAWTIPATGDFPPLLMLAMVRAMAPVAGIPPNIGVTMLAIPSPMSSVLALCFRPVTPSVTIAARRDSMAQRIAIVNAGENRFLTVSSSNFGKTGFGIGRPSASSGNLVPMVARLTPAKRSRQMEAAVPTTRATRDPGIFLNLLFHRMMRSRQPRLIPSSARLTEPMFLK